MSTERPEQNTAPGASAADNVSVPRPAPRVPDYDLLQRIGGGSYGEVWLARSVMGTYRAVKAVYRRTFEDARPFEREFAGIKRFEPVSRLHDSQVDILHVGRNGECFYYVMELADDQASGQEIDPGRYAPKTLRSELAGKGKLALRDCLNIALSLTTALEHLHRHGLVHRDIKPSNIIFINGAPKLADIGLVTGVEATRSYVGTEGYIPPEGPGAPPADLYSLGKVLYEISTGKDRQDFPEPPVFGEGTAEEREFLEFQEVLLKACEAEPRRRYQSAREMRADLELLQGGKSVKRLRVLERRLAVLTQVGLAAGILLVLAAAAYLFRAHEARQAVREAHRADSEAARAKRAEQRAQEKLREAYLAQAQARRWSGRAGRRFESLEALRKAAEIQPSLELRNEAIACLALADLRTAREWNGSPAGTTLVAFDSQYKRYARASDKGDISVRRVEDDHEILLLPGFGESAEGTLCFSPDGRRLAATYGAHALQLRVWDLDRKEIILQPQELRCRTCDFSPDNRTLAVAQHDGPILLYDLASGQVSQSLAQGPLPYSIRFHPRKRLLAVSSHASPMLEVRDLETGAVIHSFRHRASVMGLAWNPEGNLLAAGCADWNIHVWNLDTGKSRAILTGHQNAVTQVAFNHRGDRLASTGWDGTMRLWDPLNGRPLVSKPVHGGGYNFSPDDRWLGYLPDQPKLGICEVAGAPECRILCGGAEAIGSSSMCAFSPDGRWIVSAHKDGVRLWEVSSANQLEFAPEREVRGAMFHPDGKSIFTSSAAGLKQWPLEMPIPGQGKPIGSPSSFGQRDDVEKFSLSRDGQTLACVQDGRLCLFDVTTRQKRIEFEGEVPFYFSALSPDAQWAAAGDWLCTTVRVWNGRTGEVVQQSLDKGVSYLAFDPDSRWLVTGTGAAYRFWDTHSWQCIRTLRREVSGDLHGRIAFAPDGKMAAIGYSAQAVRLINLSSGEELATFEMPDPQSIYWTCFSPDGGQLAVCGPMPVIYLWDLRLVRQQLAGMKLDWARD